MVSYDTIKLVNNYKKRVLFMGKYMNKHQLARTI